MNRERLIQWFYASRRKFNFRENLSPYRVWVSEVMLQQTRAAVVEEYFERWMQNFPTVKDLAHAPIDQVIKTWEGLGYYSRARNLHEGARQIEKDFCGSFPSDVESLLKIKGIGPYTAGAIASFAFQKKAAAVDGNVLRVIARHDEIATSIEQAAVKKQIHNRVLSLLPDKNPHYVMEALIELGATLCFVKPKCQLCPINASCQAFAHETQETLPIKSAKKPSISLFREVMIIECDGEFLIKKETNPKKVHGWIYVSFLTLM